MQSGALPCNAVVGSPRRGYWVSQSSPPDLRSGLPVGSYPVLAGQRENQREGVRFQPRACDNCRLKSLQFLSFLAFYPEPVTTVLRQRTVTPTWQRYAVATGTAGVAAAFCGRLAATFFAASLHRRFLGSGFLGGGWLSGLRRRSSFGSDPGPTSLGGFYDGLFASGAELPLRRKKERHHNLSDATSSVPIAATVRRTAIP
jgi:hypothetical protein